MIDRFNSCFPHLTGEEVTDIERQIDEIENRVSALRDLTTGQALYERNHCTQIGNSIYILHEILIPQIIGLLKIQGLTDQQANLIQQEVSRSYHSSELAEAIREALIHPVPEYAE